MDDRDTRESVRRRYAEAARRMEDEDGDGNGEEVTACCVPPVGPRGPRDAGEETVADPEASGGGAACCAPDADRDDDPITAGLYGEAELEGLPDGLAEGSLGCANPVELAELQEGETVLDLGSGAGLDTLLSARRVGPTGRVYGVDMTDEMLERARANAREAGVGNVTFLQGEIEDLPLPDASVDAVISNCVINLSADKERALSEAFRVLRPGGRLAVADMAVRGSLPDAVRRSMELWAGCVAGALEVETYRRLLGDAGFEAVEIEPFRTYEAAEARDFLSDAGVELARELDEIPGELLSVFVRARKPVSETVEAGP